VKIKFPTSTSRPVYSHNNSSHPEHVVIFQKCGHVGKKAFISYTDICKGNSNAACTCSFPPEEYWTPRILNENDLMIKVEELRQMPSEFPGFCMECELRQQGQDINTESKGREHKPATKRARKGRIYTTS